MESRCATTYRPAPTPPARRVTSPPWSAATPSRAGVCCATASCCSTTTASCSPTAAPSPITTSGWPPPDQGPSASPRVPGGLLELLPIALPPRRVGARRQVVAARPQPRGAVHELADDVGMPGVPVRLGDDVHQNLLQGHLRAIARPPRHPADGLQRQRVDGRVRHCPCPVVERQDVLAGLLRG